MILATVFHPDLPVDYKQLASEIRAKGPNRPHTLLAICRPEDESETAEWVFNLSDCFTRHYMGVTLADGNSPLHLSNMMFQTACRFLKAYKPEAHEPEGVPLVYLNPTWRPVGKRWMDILQGEFFMNGAPQVMRNGDSQGAVVIGKKYPETSILLDQVPENQHWRNYLTWEMQRNAVETPLLGELVKPRPVKTP
jgi:hypothetical protein